MAMKVLVVLTGVEKYPTLNEATGIWLAEAVHFVKVVEGAGMTVDYVSPEGGYTPIDPNSLAIQDPTEWEWYRNKSFMNRLGATIKASDVKPEDYAAIYFVGGHGVMWDFPDNEALQEITKRIYESGGVVSSVCHGVVGLLNVKLSDGTYLVHGKHVTGFSNDEENAINKSQAMPFMTEDMLKERGAIYEKADQPWAPKVVADGCLITGQNPASSEGVAELVVKQLHAKV